MPKKTKKGKNKKGGSNSQSKAVSRGVQHCWDIFAESLDQTSIMEAVKQRQLKAAMQAYIELWWKYHNLERRYLQQGVAARTSQAASDEFAARVLQDQEDADVRHLAQLPPAHSRCEAAIQNQEFVDLLAADAADVQKSMRKAKERLGSLGERMQAVMASLAGILDESQLKLFKLIMDLDCAAGPVADISQQIQMQKYAAQASLQSYIKHMSAKGRQVTAADLKSKAFSKVVPNNKYKSPVQLFLLPSLAQCYRVFMRRLREALQDKILKAALDGGVTQVGIQRISKPFGVIDNPVMASILIRTFEVESENYFSVINNGKKLYFVHFYRTIADVKYLGDCFAELALAEMPAEQRLVRTAVFLLTEHPEGGLQLIEEDYHCCCRFESEGLLNVFRLRPYSGPYFLAPYRRKLLYKNTYDAYVQLTKTVYKGIEDGCAFVEYLPEGEGRYVKSEGDIANCHFVEVIEYLDGHGMSDCSLCIPADGSPVYSVCAIFAEDIDASGYVSLEVIHVSSASADSGGGGGAAHSPHRKLSITNTQVRGGAVGAEAGDAPDLTTGILQNPH